MSYREYEGGPLQRIDYLRVNELPSAAQLYDAACERIGIAEEGVKPVPVAENQQQLLDELVNEIVLAYGERQMAVINAEVTKDVNLEIYQTALSELVKKQLEEAKLTRLLNLLEAQVGHFTRLGGPAAIKKLSQTYGEVESDLESDEVTGTVLDTSFLVALGRLERDKLEDTSKLLHDAYFKVRQTIEAIHFNFPDLVDIKELEIVLESPSVKMIDTYRVMLNERFKEQIIPLDQKKKESYEKLTAAEKTLANVHNGKELVMELARDTPKLVENLKAMQFAEDLLLTVRGLTSNPDERIAKPARQLVSTVQKYINSVRYAEEGLGVFKLDRGLIKALFSKGDIADEMKVLYESIKEREEINIVTIKVALLSMMEMQATGAYEMYLG